MRGKTGLWLVLWSDNKRICCRFPFFGRAGKEVVVLLWFRPCGCVGVGKWWNKVNNTKSLYWRWLFFVCQNLLGVGTYAFIIRQGNKELIAAHTTDNTPSLKSPLTKWKCFKLVILGTLINYRPHCLSLRQSLDSFQLIHCRHNINNEKQCWPGVPACLPSLAILGVYFGPFHALGRLGCY